VEIVPAERPAMVSTSAGERRAWLSVIREGLKVSCCELCRRKSGDGEVKLKILWNLPRLRNEQLI
jgi:hypothetical protein